MAFRFFFQLCEDEGEQNGPDISKKPRFHRQMENGVLYFTPQEKNEPPLNRPVQIFPEFVTGSVKQGNYNAADPFVRCDWFVV